jgi:hypothetical protein
VQNACRVRVLQSFEKALGNRERVVERKRSLLTPTAESVALDVLHCNERFTARLADLVKGRDGRMLQPCKSVCFVKKSRSQFCREPAREPLQSRLAPEREIARTKDFAHSARANPLENLVVPNYLASRESRPVIPDA